MSSDTSQDQPFAALRAIRGARRGGQEIAVDGLAGHKARRVQSYTEALVSKRGLPSTRRARAVRGLTGCQSPPSGSACEDGATGPTILLVEIKLLRRPGQITATIVAGNASRR
jgi:hypothetical protein